MHVLSNRRIEPFCVSGASIQHLRGTEIKTYPLEEALKAQKALRDAANLDQESFPIQAFVGMISDEVEALRKMGKSDEEIARLIESESQIRVSGAEIAENYASP
jgi:hypothetical protein